MIFSSTIDICILRKQTRKQKVARCAVAALVPAVTTKYTNIHTNSFLEPVFHEQDEYNPEHNASTRHHILVNKNASTKIRIV